MPLDSSTPHDRQDVGDTDKRQNNSIPESSAPPTLAHGSRGDSAHSRVTNEKHAASPAVLAGTDAPLGRV